MEKKGDDGFDETGLPGVDIKGADLVDMSVVDVVVDDVQEAEGNEGENDDVIEAGNEKTNAVDDGCTDEEDSSKVRKVLTSNVMLLETLICDLVVD